MRFYVPNNELEMLQEEEEKKKPAKKRSGSQSAEEEEEEDEGDQRTAAKLLNEKIIKAAGIGEFAGEMIATFP